MQNVQVHAAALLPMSAVNTGTILIRFTLYYIHSYYCNIIYNVEKRSELWMFYSHDIILYTIQGGERGGDQVIHHTLPVLAMKQCQGI